MTKPGKSENELVEWIRRRCVSADTAVQIGVGDDMAMVRAGSDVLVTVDMLMDGVDFDSTIHTPLQIGRKALAVSLSDCAAMAVRPRWALVSVALPNAWSMQQAQGLYEGIKALAKTYDAHVIGGDTNSWDKPLVIDVAVIAEPWPGVKPISRSGMRPGDGLYVTGKLGGSLSGRHLTFEPRIHEAKQLAETLGDSLHAMIDLSDGLSTDAHRVAKASGCGIELDEAALVACATDAAREMAESARPEVRVDALLDHILNDGEDFELFFAAAEGKQGMNDAVQVTHIGRAVEQSGVWLRQADGSRRVIESHGWQHFREVQ